MQGPNYDKGDTIIAVHDSEDKKIIAGELFTCKGFCAGCGGTVLSEDETQVHYPWETFVKYVKADGTTPKKAIIDGITKEKVTFSLQRFSLIMFHMQRNGLVPVELVRGEIDLMMKEFDIVHEYNAAFWYEHEKQQYAKP